VDSLDTTFYWVATGGDGLLTNSDFESPAEPISDAVMQSLPLDGVVIVSSPQMLATEIVVKCIKMVQTLKGKLLGVVENMAYLTMPDGSRNELFGPSNGAELVAMTGAPLLAQLPIDRDIAMLCDAGHLEDYHSEEFATLASNFIKALAIAGKRA
ncbi:MAG: P-loop NTPase, partial [Ktedonobacterales bacterium]